MLDSEDIFKGLLLIVLIVVACLLIASPPHTDPGVEVIEPGVARVHRGETLILWVPSGKSSTKYSFSFDGETVKVSGLFYQENRTISEGCKTFRVSLFYKVEACRDGRDIIFKWNESLLGLRIDR
jgi:hypothetical protein